MSIFIIVSIITGITVSSISLFFIKRSSDTPCNGEKEYLKRVDNHIGDMSSSLAKQIRKRTHKAT